MIEEQEASAGPVPPPGTWSTRRRRWIDGLKLAGFALSVALVAWVLPDALKGVRFDEENLLLFALAAVPATLSWLSLAWAWAGLVGSEASSERTSNSASGGTRDAIRTWTRSQALRYLPGSIWAPAVRATSVDGSRITKASVVAVETALTLASSAGVGALFMTADGRWHWVPLLAVPAVVPLVVRLAGKRSAVPFDRVLVATGRNLVSTIMYGVTILLAQWAIGPLHHPLTVIGAGCLARAVGMVAVFSPGGVGVREVAYIAIVSSFLAKDQAAAGAIGARLVMTLVELAVLVAVAIPWLRDRARESIPANQSPPQTWAQAAPRRTAQNDDRVKRELA